MTTDACPVCGGLMVADSATADERRALMADGIMPPPTSRGDGSPLCSECGVREALAIAGEHLPG